MKNLWLRAGVTLQLNDDEVDTILKTGADDNGDMDVVENIVKTALQEGRFAFDGNSYLPEPVVESLIQAEGLPYAPSEPEFDMNRLGGFTLAKPAVKGDMLSRASALLGQIVNEKDYRWSGVLREVTVNSDGISLFVNSGGYNFYVAPDQLRELQTPTPVASDGNTEQDLVGVKTPMGALVAHEAPDDEYPGIDIYLNKQDGGQVLVARVEYVPGGGMCEPEQKDPRSIIPQERIQFAEIGYWSGTQKAVPVFTPGLMVRLYNDETRDEPITIAYNDFKEGE
jgi:hypothetical protein